MRADSRAYTSSPAPVIATAVSRAMTTVMRVRTETRAKGRRARSVVPVGVVAVVRVVVIVVPVVPLVVVILPDRCRMRCHDAGVSIVTAPGSPVRAVVPLVVRVRPGLRPGRRPGLLGRWG